MNELEQIGNTPEAPAIAGKRRAPGQRPGEQHSRSRLTNDQARAIRSAYASGECSYRGLAPIYGVRPMTIRDVVTWKSYVLAGGDTTHAKIWTEGKPRKARPVKRVLGEGEPLVELTEVAPW